jgi:hypothetical protein
MLTNLPDSLVLIFLLTVILTFLLFINAVKNKPTYGGRIGYLAGSDRHSFF